MTDIDPFYRGTHEQYTESDTLKLPDGTEVFGDDAREHNYAEFLRVLSQATEKDFQRDTGVGDYARTTIQPGRVRADDEWQPHQAESASAVRAELYAKECPVYPFSLAASEALDKHGTDPSVPNDLSSLPDSGEGPTAVG